MEAEREMKKNAAIKAQSFYINKRFKNSSGYHKRQLCKSRDPDKEAIMGKTGKILLAAEDITARYREYYKNLLEKEAKRKEPPNEQHKARWMNETVLKSNRNAALNGVLIADTLPMLEEYLAVINKRDTSSSGGLDCVQYKVLQKLLLGTPSYSGLNIGVVADL